MANFTFICLQLYLPANATNIEVKTNEGPPTCLPRKTFTSDNVIYLSKSFLLHVYQPNGAHVLHRKYTFPYHF